MIKKSKLIKLINVAQSCSVIARDYFYKLKQNKIYLKNDKSPVTSADLEINKLAITELKKLFPNDIIISEECKKKVEFNLEEKFWLVDPIDGTKEFIDGSENFTINFALIHLNQCVFGLIAQPCTNTVWFTFKKKSWKIKDSYDIKHAKIIKCKKFQKEKIRLIASKNHFDSELKAWINLINPTKIANVGSSIKFCKLAEGQYDVYPRNLPTSEWDTAAGHSILKYAGGNILTTNGLELYYGKNKFRNGRFVAVGSYNKFYPIAFFLGGKDFNIENYFKKIDRAVYLLNTSKLVCFPTETVYGLGAKGDNVEAINKIYTIKNRPKSNPLIAHVHNIKLAKKYVEFTKIAEKLANAFWPGPLSLVLQIKKQNKIAKLVSQQKNTLAIRIPSHPVSLDIINKLKVPILAPSANKSGSVSPTNANHVKQEFSENQKNKASKFEILDFGNCEIGIESTVVDCRGQRPIILREGFITKEMIENILKLKVINIIDHEDTLSPGMLKKHYSPETKVLINQKKYIKGSGCLSFGKLPKIFSKSISEFNLSPTGNLIQAAELLYEGLRYLDKKNLRYIQVLPIPIHGIGKAINDRLERASHGQ